MLIFSLLAGKVGYGFERPDMAVPGEFSLTKRSVNRHESSSSHPPSTPAERSVLTTPTASLFPGYRPYDDARVPKPKNATVGQNSNNNVAYGLNIAADDAAAIRSEHKNPKPVDFFGLSNLFVDEDADGSDIDEDGEDLVHEDRVHSVRHDTTGTTSVKSPHLQPINALDALASLYGDDNSDDEEERSFGNGTHHFHTFLQPSPSSTMTSWRCEKDQQRNRSTNRVCDLAGTLWYEFTQVSGKGSFRF
ncbi:hypothetical protein BC936DRAFT_141716 [Jimgerdemannia flammicorona]|uniref:Uncharacterized protein n=1 Tax=Jimgerdemannia flammicorona TaxID=994334 RepID=A0A433A1R8_9FUNG|nr:hypothetical protein BC936DRAFT_141716 [Jimgerdemannia flammicorona]